MSVSVLNIFLMLLQASEFYLFIYIFFKPKLLPDRQKILSHHHIKDNKCLQMYLWHL